jgi:hypothetical protein
VNGELVGDVVILSEAKDHRSSLLPLPT